MSFHNWDNCEELEKLCSSIAYSPSLTPFFCSDWPRGAADIFHVIPKKPNPVTVAEGHIPIQKQFTWMGRYTVDSKPKTTGAHLQNLLNWKYLPWVPIIAQSSVWQPSRYVHRRVLSWKRVFTKIDLCFYLWCKNKKPQKLKYSSRPQD